MPCRFTSALCNFASKNNHDNKKHMYISALVSVLAHMGILLELKKCGLVHLYLKVLELGLS